MARSLIEWTGFVWNFILGCTKCSPGCERCYAINEVGRERCEAHKGLAVLQPVPNWTGLIRFRPESLSQPLNRTIPSKWFVNSLSDFFHEAVPLDWQRAGLEVMRLADWHVFQILTKREKQLRNLLNGDLRGYAGLPNVMWGVSVEDCKHGLPRIDALRESPARIKWLSIEPLLENLGPIDLDGIDWVVVGGESGANARPVKVDWVVSIKDQCEAFGVPFFFKQWGNWAPAEGTCSGRMHVWQDGSLSERKSKKEAGRTLQGEEFDSSLELENMPNSPPAAVRRGLQRRAAEMGAGIRHVEVLSRPSRAREVKVK
ncbi:phage Gp37/Gp68 family protein [Candidatus Kaiserbacteria bacterium]|nr:phage Gp37/Gp68 family protein [Candidatus Kaiserbacteria bacterium]